MTDVNDEFGLGDATPQTLTPPPPKATRGRAKADGELDPERDRENWPVIIIEREKDRPNFEFLQVMGTYQDGSPLVHQLRVQRGVEVQVPPSIVKMLRNSVAAHYEQRHDPVSGHNVLERSDRSAVPWRLVRGGKYIQ